MLALVRPAAAADERQKKAAVALAEQGAKAFQAGDMAKAASQYLLAARTDPEEPNYLYGAARAEQADRQLDAAEQHYKAFVVAPGADPTRVAKVQSFLGEIRLERARLRAVEAERLGQKGDPVLAAPTWLEAYQLAPERPLYLLNAALAERESGDSAACMTHLEAYLRAAPADATERPKATALLRQMQKAAGRRSEPIPPPEPPKPPPVAIAPPPPAAPLPEPPRPAPQPVPVAVPPAAPQALPQPAPKAAAPPASPQLAAPAAPPPPEPASTRGVGIWTLAVGAALAVAGGGVLAWGLSEQSAFNRDVGLSDGAVHTAMSREEALARAATIGQHQTAGVIVGGAGLAAAGVGLWLWLRAPDAVAVFPTATGVACSARF